MQRGAGGSASEAPASVRMESESAVQAPSPEGWQLRQLLTCSCGTCACAAAAQQNSAAEEQSITATERQHSSMATQQRSSTAAQQLQRSSTAARPWQHSMRLHSSTAQQLELYISSTPAQHRNHVLPLYTEAHECSPSQSFSVTCTVVFPSTNSEPDVTFTTVNVALPSAIATFTRTKLPPTIELPPCRSSPPGRSESTCAQLQGTLTAAQLQSSALQLGGHGARPRATQLQLQCSGPSATSNTDGALQVSDTLSEDVVALPFTMYSSTAK